MSLLDYMISFKLKDTGFPNSRQVHLRLGQNKGLTLYNVIGASTQLQTLARAGKNAVSFYQFNKKINWRSVTYSCGLPVSSVSRLRKITKQKGFSGLDEGLQLFYIASVYKFFIHHNIFFLNRV